MRKLLTLMITAVTVGLLAATVPAGPALAEPVCQPGTNWDGVLKICR
ncbi:hypothetical protein [Winogradskya humida]|uniref:Uncharacterized protein n=1 Tax=Winogradskya humida TaxID=113566 RepID=A0ABQ3ZXX2_9ACTN|nr:hypothetical protein [Actinoplanes humidus]GIE23461.1 hypothetical protein Ahu01nite_065630 [Actinoplanes humidus]